MMDELTPSVKLGLVNLIFGIYENDVKEVCNALEEIGILRKGVDRVSVEKIVRYFLNEFSNGIKPGEKWSGQLPPEEQAKIRKQRRLKLGADLFSVGNDVPFSFPPTFTFVFRAFTSLDGIGKGLDQNYDLTRLAQPFLKELVDLRDGSATLSLMKSLAKQVGWRPQDISNTIQQPRKIAYLEELFTKIEQGDLKLRVRVLESERAFQKLTYENSNLAVAMAAALCLNFAILLTQGGSIPLAQWSIPARVSMFFAGLLGGIKLPIGLIKLKSLEKKFASFDQ
jgi:predicted unusual protein kinase regulating ubiquinone biosynthesis (AarF/ABC1/UbiB family)